MKLYIGNKNYSSWSMRPWILLRQSGIAFEEVMVRFDAFSADSQFKARLGKVSPAGKVPVLVDGDLVVWDTLAIAEYAAEWALAQSPSLHLWPKAAPQRAHARSMCAEMHSGFSNLRSHCPMNIEASLPHIGERIMAEQSGVRADLARLVQMWQALLALHAPASETHAALHAETHTGRHAEQGMLFGAFSVADAYFAPVCSRIRTYGLPVPPDVAAYVDRVHALSAMRQWREEALLEADFVNFDEPYRTAR